MKSSSAQKIRRSVELVWSHMGVLHRVTPWPELSFSRQSDGEWVEYEPDPSDACFASAAVMLDDDRWRQFLEFLPSRERQFVNEFKYARLAAVVVIHHCPALLDDLMATPALLPFVAAHSVLRGQGPRWSEIDATHERGGIFACLEWLGLPSSRQTLSVLRKVTNPDLAQRLLEPLRSALWEPEAIWFLEHADSLSEQQLATRCHALAA